MGRTDVERLPRAIVALIVAALAAGCGGGGGGGEPDPGPPTTHSEQLGSDAALDGTVTSDGTAEPDGSFVGPLAGDGDTAVDGRVLAAYFSFDLSALPAGAQVTSAELRVYQLNVYGSPYATHGHLRVRSVDYGASLDPADWAPPSYGAVDMGPATAASEAKVTDVTALLQEAVAAGRPRFQVRIAFSDLGSDADGESDAVHLVDAQDAGSTGHPPVLDVQYTTS